MFASVLLIALVGARPGWAQAPTDGWHVTVRITKSNYQKLAT